MQEAALKWTHVHYSVRSGFWLRKKPILKDVTCALYPGSVLGLIGPNGAGKTTSIKLGAGLISPDQGEACIYGRPATDTAMRRHTGLLTEAQYLYPFLKLQEWLDLMGGLSGLGSSERKHRISEVSALLDLSGLLGQMMASLSKGQAQRAGLAQALLHKPEILLLDEPMSGLDPYWRFRFLRIFLDYKQKGGTILFSSHILSDVEHLSDDIVLLEKGTVQWNGRLSDLPRRVKGYEVLCSSESYGKLATWAKDGSFQREPSGALRFNIAPESKDDFLKTVINSGIELQALQPQTEELEELLFNFSEEMASGQYPTI